MHVIAEHLDTSGLLTAPADYKSKGRWEPCDVLEAILTDSTGKFQKTVFAQNQRLGQTKYVTLIIHIAAANFSKHVSQGRSYAINHNKMWLAPLPKFMVRNWPVHHLLARVSC